MKLIRETDRLFIRHYTKNDAAHIFELLNSAGWINNIGDRGIKTQDDAASYLVDIVIPEYKDKGYGFYMCELKDGNIPIGMNGLIHRPGLDNIDIGYALLPQYYGQGYAYEASKAIVDHAKHDIGSKKLLAITTPENQKSINVLIRIGMTYVDQITLPKIEGISNLYEMEL